MLEWALGWLLPAGYTTTIKVTSWCPWLSRSAAVRCVGSPDLVHVLLWDAVGGGPKQPRYGYTKPAYRRTSTIFTQHHQQQQAGTSSACAQLESRLDLQHHHTLYCPTIAPAHTN